jgi:ribonuclease HI
VNLGSGCVIGNKEDQIVFIYFKFNGKVTNNQVEMIALIEGGKFCRSYNLNSIEIEGYLKIIIVNLNERASSKEWFL